MTDDDLSRAVSEGQEAPEGDGVTPKPDDLYRSLAGPQRRRILYYLLDTPQTSVDELADVLTGWQSTGTGPAGPDERGRIEAALRHVDLPTLAETGLVDYDHEDGTVALASLNESVTALIRFANRYEDRASGRQTVRR